MAYHRPATQLARAADFNLIHKFSGRPNNHIFETELLKIIWDF
jgi:hypothetical protein